MALIDNILAYYKFDSSNSNDSVGSKNGTDTSITYSSGNGKINVGAGFGGASKIALGTAISLPGAMSVSVWAKLTDVTATQYILGDRASGWGQYGLGMNHIAAGKLTFIWGNGTTVATYDAPVSLTNGVMAHFVATRDASGNVVLYVNNTVVTGSFTNGSASVAVYASPQGGAIGTAGDANFLLTGATDEPGYWNRAITASEVSQLYNGGAGLQYPFTASTNSAFFLFMN